MKDYEKEIARKYILPERPFLHGMVSAFDLFGVLGRDSLTRINDRQKVRTLQSGAEAVNLVWQEVGDTLLLAIDHYRKETSEGDPN